MGIIDKKFKNRINQQMDRLDPRKEYMSASSGFGLLDSGKVLNWSADDLSEAYGGLDKVYDKMLTDPEIAKCITICKISIIGDGMEIIPNLNEIHPDYEKSVQVADFVTKCFRNLQKPIKDTIFQLLDALVYGHKIAEITYEFKNIAGYKGTKMLPYSIKVKPLRAVQFVIDDKYNVIGFVGNRRKTITKAKNAEIDISVSKNKAVVKLEGEEEKIEFIPRDKFIVLTINPKDEDPRGNSILRSGFTAWHAKTQIYPEYLRFLFLSAIPILVGTTPEPKDGISSVVGYITNPDGSYVKDAFGNNIPINPVEALRDALLTARNAGVIAAVGGTTIKEIGVSGSGSQFYKAFETYNGEMEMGILLQTLAVSEGKYQSRAASQMHMSVLDNLIYYLKSVVIDALYNDLVAKWIRFNFGEEGLQFAPKLTLGDTERREFSTDATAVATLYGSGFISEDQKKALDAILGLPIRDSHYDKFRDITPEEALQVSKATYELNKLNAESARIYNEALAAKIKAALELSKVDDEEIKQSAVNIIKSILNGLQEQIDNDVDESNRVLETLIKAGSTANSVLNPQKSDLGDYKRLPISDIGRVDSAIAGPGSNQGPPVSGNYITVKNNPATFGDNRDEMGRKRKVR